MNGISLVIAVLGGMSVFFLIIAFLPARNVLAERLERMENVKERSVHARFALIERIATGSPPELTQMRLMRGGWYSVTPLSLTLRGLAGMGFGTCVGLMLVFALPNKTIGIVSGAVIALLGWRAPKIALDRAIKARALAIGRALPGFLDTLSTMVQAGSALNAAMLTATNSVSGPLRDELQSTLAEIRMGRARSEALSALADRSTNPQLRTMITALLQAEALGSNISQVLRELSADVRNHRWMLAEERGAQLPIKMIFPMALLMLPSLYVMIFGPVLAGIIGHR